MRWVLDLNVAPVDAGLSWGTDFRRRHRTDPAFRAFLDVIESWQSNPVLCRTIREDARRTLAGEPASDGATILLRTLASAERTAPELYRGVGAKERAWAVFHQYSIGLEFDIPLASFTTQRARAEEFAWMAGEDGDTEVVFVLRAEAGRLGLMFWRRIQSTGENASGTVADGSLSSIPTSPLTAR